MYRISKEDWTDYWEAGQKWFSNITSHNGTDQVCKDAGRAYYVKASKDDNITMGYSSWDKPFLLDLRSIVTEVRKEKRFKEKIQQDLQKNGTEVHGLLKML